MKRFLFVILEFNTRSNNTNKVKVKYSNKLTVVISAAGSIYDSYGRELIT